MINCCWSSANRYAFAPLLTERDEEESHEGGIDPLGTEPLTTTACQLFLGFREVFGKVPLSTNARIMSDESSQRKWFYIDPSGETQGPMPLEEVQQRNVGIGSYYLFTAGLSDWVQVSDLPKVLAKLEAEVLEPVPPVIGDGMPAAQNPAVGFPPESQLATENQRRWLIALGADPSENLLKSQASVWIAQLEGSGVRPTPKALDEYQQWKGTSQGPLTMAWRDDKASDKQKILLTLYGMEAGPEMTKGEASDLITQKEKENPIPKKEHSRRYNQLKGEYEQKEQDKKIEEMKVQICSYLDSMKPLNAPLDDLQSAQYFLKEIIGEVFEELKERIQYEKEVAAERKGRYRDVQELFSKDGMWSGILKKPSKAQAEAVLMALDKLHPGDHRHDEIEILEQLRKMFPQLEN